MPCPSDGPVLMDSIVEYGKFAAAIVYAALPTLSCILGATLAFRRRRSALLWGLVGFLLPVLGVLLLIALPSRLQHCLQCSHRCELGWSTCAHCGATLPTESEVRLGVVGRVDGTCSECAAPFSYADYRDDATEIRCSRCDASLPARP